MGIKNLKNKHVLVPIEQLLIQTSGGVDYVISGSVNIYKSDVTVISHIYGLDISAPLPLSSFTQSYINGSGDFVMDAHYKEKVELTSYDQFNNLLQSQQTNNIPTCYLWNYNKTYPVAEISNASYASVAATSFEGDGKGNWTYNSAGVIAGEGITGNKAFSLGSYSIDHTALSASEVYTMTYWLKNGTGSVSLGGSSIKTANGWTLFSTTVTGVTSLSITGSGAIDELRLYPQKAQMITYTFDPLIGMTSKCDEGNVITYYKYDSQLRLRQIEDQDKKILKVIDYKFKEQY